VRGPRSDEGQAQFSAKPLKHGIKVFADLSVGEARDAHAQAFEDLCSPGVLVGEPFVLPAVPPDHSPGVDDVFCGVAGEVGEVSVDRDLPPEFRAVAARARAVAPTGFLLRASSACAGRGRTVGDPNS